MKTVFLRALQADDKAAALRQAIHEPQSERGDQRFEIDVSRLSQIHSAPFAYWASTSVVDLFMRLPSLATAGRIARTTNPTYDDFRFARAWWEPASSEIGTRWRAWNKGGGSSPYYRDIDLVIDWDHERGTYLGYIGSVHRPDIRPANRDYFFRAGLTWVYRGPRLCVQAMPAGTAISTRGNGLYSQNDTLRLFDLGLLNSAVADYLIKLSLGRDGHPQFDIGDLSRIPVPDATAVVCRLARRAWSLRRQRDARTDTSHAFTLPALIHVNGDCLVSRNDAWNERTHTIEAELAEIQAEIDMLCVSLYGIDEADRREIAKGFAASTATLDEACDSDKEDGYAEDGGAFETDVDAAVLAAELVSWAVGVALGRFDVRLATGARPLPPEPEPFDPLPICSPAMLTDAAGLPLLIAPNEYPVTFPENGILVDDPGHSRDVGTAIRRVFDEVFDASADTWWNELGAVLDPKSHDLRAWLIASFFEHHLKRHSRSRRRAPLVWQLGVPSGRYSVWLYAHRLTIDSFFQVQNDVVAPKLAHEEARLASLVQNSATPPSARERKLIAAQQTLVEELRAFLEDVKCIAPIWCPSLDDGVIITMAPLWRLVPQHKPWQKELKTKWDELAAGKYDWARLAMHLWPERVLPKCVTDRSLAIAHGLEDVLWAKGDDGKWEVRPIPTPSLEELVRERTSAAVKAALKFVPVSPTAAPKARVRRAGLP